MGCKTDGGLTVLLIERGEGVETKQIKTSYSTTAGTACMCRFSINLHLLMRAKPQT